MPTAAEFSTVLIRTVEGHDLGEVDLAEPLTASEVMAFVPDGIAADVTAQGETAVLHVVPNAVEVVTPLPAGKKRDAEALVGSVALAADETDDLIGYDSGLSGMTPRTAGETRYKRIFCDNSYAFNDTYGRFTVQRQCGVNKAPWSFRWAGWVQEMAFGGVMYEAGLTWTRNGARQSQMKPHTEAASYLWHGTFTAVAGDKVTYEDFFTWTPSSPSSSNGGFINGRLVFRSVG